jgi:predicted negative regulator of RcsB-dependent stress response
MTGSSSDDFFKNEDIHLTDYLTEQEQIQQLKNWVKTYGLTILLGITVALLITTGWRYWQKREDKILTHASLIYDRMLSMRSQNNTDAAATQANKLITRYSKTPYAGMAAFMLARDAILQKDYPKAKQQLYWAMDHTPNLSMKEIARIRIARILMNEKQPDSALTLLNHIDDHHYIGLIDEARGDAYLLKNDKKSAHDSYELALKELPNAEISRPILLMKFNNVV